MDFCLSPSESTPLSATSAPFVAAQIRFAQFKDIQGLSEVLLQSFHPAGDWLSLFHPLLRLGIHEDLRARLRAPKSDYYCLLAIAHPSQEIIGTTEISLKNWYYPQTRTGYISNLAVSPAFRRHGVARQLLLKCELVAQEWQCHGLALHVLDNNHQAKTLYTGLGYQTKPMEFSWPSGFFPRPRRLLLEKTLRG